MCVLRGDGDVRIRDPPVVTNDARRRRGSRSSAANSGSRNAALGEDGVADELGDEPPHDVRPDHPREARLEHSHAMVCRNAAGCGKRNNEGEGGAREEILKCICRE